MGYDFYKSLQNVNTGIKHENMMKVIDKLAGRGGGVLYSVLEQEIKKMGCTKNDLDTVLEIYYVTKKVNGTKIVFTNSSAFPSLKTTKTKEKKVGKKISSVPPKKDVELVPFKEMDNGFKKTNVNYKSSTKKSKPTTKNTPTWVRNIPTKQELKQRNAIEHVVYRFLDKDGQIIYVGRAKNLESRLYKHGQNGHLPAECYKQVVKIEFTRFTSEDDLDLAEPYYIAKWKPEFNQDFKNKNYSFAIEPLEVKAWENYKHVGLLKKHVA